MKQSLSGYDSYRQRHPGTTLDEYKRLKRGPRTKTGAIKSAWHQGIRKKKAEEKRRKAISEGMKRYMAEKYGAKRAKAEAILKNL